MNHHRVPTKMYDAAWLHQIHREHAGLSLAWSTQHTAQFLLYSQSESETATNI